MQTGESDVLYCCPGDGVLISRSIHFGRLATFYPACGACEYRADVGTLARETVAQIAASHAHAAPADLVNDEGLDGLLDNQIDARTVRKFAAASRFAWLAEFTRVLPPKVVLGADGRPLTAELLAAASEGLRQTGCTVVEVEAVTAPTLCQAVSDLDAAGGLLLGNPLSMPHTVGIRLWTRGGVPVSAGGALDSVREAFLSGSPRPTRSSGKLERHCADGPYLARFSGLFHALRPLTFILDTGSTPLVQYVRQLTAATACRVLAPRSKQVAAAPQPAEHRAANKGGRIVGAAGSSLGGAFTSASPSPPTALAADQARMRRLAWLVEQIPAERADFGIWIDGDGERCAVVDERGKVVPPDRLLSAIGRLELNDQSGAVVVAEVGTSERALEAMRAAGLTLISSPPQRERMGAAMLDANAAIGGGPSGRFWFPGRPPVPDALTMLGWLLTVLSRGDRPLSVALEAS